MQNIRVLSCGIPESFIDLDLGPMFQRVGYEPEFSYSSGFEEAGNRLRETYDLLLLGDSRRVPNYSEVVNFAQENSETPSIMVVANLYRTVLGKYNNVHPPNATRTYTEVENLSRNEIERIIGGENVPWRL